VKVKEENLQGGEFLEVFRDWSAIEKWHGNNVVIGRGLGIPNLIRIITFNCLGIGKKISAS